MLVLTPKYSSQINLDLLKKQKDKTKEPLIKHRNDVIDLNLVLGEKIRTINTEDMNMVYEKYLLLKNKCFIIPLKLDRLEHLRYWIRQYCKDGIVDVEWVDVSGFDDYSYLFAYTDIKELHGLLKWDVSNVKCMEGMFERSKYLTTISGIDKWDVMSVENMKYMFAECEMLNTLDLSKWQLDSCEHIDSMFSRCYQLTSTGDLSLWNVSKCTSLSCLFEECSLLNNIGDINGWDVSNILQKKNGTYHTFFRCFALTNIPSWYTEN